jgi:hypothetical protein
MGADPTGASMNQETLTIPAHRGGGVRSALPVLLAPVLVLLTPFLSFLGHERDVLLRPEGLICLAAFVAVGFACGVLMLIGGVIGRVVILTFLLILFVDLQFDFLTSTRRLALVVSFIAAIVWLLRQHIVEIVSVVFATMLAATFVIPPAPPPAGWHAAAAGPQAAGQELPILVHLIFDEHIGVEAVPEDVPGGAATKRLLRSFYLDNGFRLWGSAYSRYTNTIDAIPNAMNFSASDRRLALVRDKSLVGSRYLDALQAQGYRIHIAAQEYIKFCDWNEAKTTACMPYGFDDLHVIGSLDLPAARKAELILMRQSQLSTIRRKAQYLYVRSLLWLDPERRRLPAWWWPRGSIWWWGGGAVTGPIPALRALREVQDLVAAAAPGDMFLVYLQLPHFPYLFDAECRAQDPGDDWRSARDTAPLPPNTDASRRLRYSLYFEQIGCLYKELGMVFERWRAAGVWDRAMIVIHGDHSSRIWRREPHVRNRAELTREDLLDMFPTLFALKIPEAAAGYDSTPRPVEQLLAEAIHAEAPTARPAPVGNDYVYVQSDDPDRYEPLPFRDFMVRQ